ALVAQRARKDGSVLLVREDDLARERQCVRGREIVAVEERLDAPLGRLLLVDPLVADVARVARRHARLVGGERVGVAIGAVELLERPVPLVAERLALLPRAEEAAARERERREGERSRGARSPA